MIELIIFLILLYIVMSVVIWSLKTGISPMFSSFQVISYISKEIVKYDKKTIVDLGSGWGLFAVIIAKNNPLKKVIGYELSPFPFYFSKFLASILQIKNIHFYKRDFFKEKLNNDSLYFSYLFPKGMDNLEKKIIDGNTNILLISSTFALPTIKAFEKKNLNDILKTPIYIYKIKNT